MSGSETLARVELFIGGRVQGVFYRASAREEADRLGLVGEVRNLPDGRVHAVAEGPRDLVREFIEWCRKGPPAAQVEEVEERWHEPCGGFSSFRVAR